MEAASWQKLWDFEELHCKLMAGMRGGWVALVLPKT